MAANPTPFAIVSLPRSGSTTLANIVNQYPNARCLIEPFHPRRYNGHFNRIARQLSVSATLEGIWTKWNGIKHVWDSSGFPFHDQPSFNEEIIRVAGQVVVMLVRTNQLKRLVSHHICRHTGYWIGTRTGFRSRLDATHIPPLRPEAVRRELQRDHAAIEARLALLKREQIPHMLIHYEALFGLDGVRQREVVGQLRDFLGIEPQGTADFAERWLPLLDRSANQWATADIYRQIPEIDRLEQDVGSETTGWLFRD